jgi:hypothetical protein
MTVPGYWSIIDWKYPVNPVDPVRISLAEEVFDRIYRIDRIST